MRDVIVWVVGVCLLALVAPLANAELVTINIEGVVDTVEDDGYCLEDQIHVGDIITGWYTYDTATPDTNPSTNGADYWHYSPPCGIFLTVGGFEFRTDSANVNVLIEIVDNYPPDDDYLLRSYNNLSLSNGSLVDHISWWLYDPTGTALSSDDLSTTPPVLENWNLNDLTIYGERVGYLIHGHVTSAIPEPATIFLLVVGACVALRKRS